MPNNKDIRIPTWNQQIAERKNERYRFRKERARQRRKLRINVKFGKEIQKLYHETVESAIIIQY